MHGCEDEERDRRVASDSVGREAASGPGRGGTTPLDLCGQARVAETYRLESSDDACDDGIR
jgi:hypothetical protein